MERNVQIVYCLSKFMFKKIFHEVDVEKLLEIFSFRKKCII